VPAPVRFIRLTALCEEVVGRKQPVGLWNRRLQIVKAGIAALAAQAESPAKLAEDLGLVGCFDSGVGDLGRNHSQRLREKLAGQPRRG
jgi:hypothetical protein